MPSLSPDAATRFERVPLRPLECLREGWRLVRPQYWTFLAVTTVGLVVGSLTPLGLVLGPMICGVYVCLFRAMRGERAGFDGLRRGFDYFVDAFVATLVQVVPMMAITIPVNLFFALELAQRVLRWMGPPYDEVLTLVSPRALLIALAVLTALLYAISVLVGVYFMFSYPLIVDRGLKGLLAVKTSARAAAANLGGALALMALTTLVSIAGALCLYVGAFLVTPVTLAAWAVAYRKVFPEADAGE